MFRELGKKFLIIPIFIFFIFFLIWIQRIFNIKQVFIERNNTDCVKAENIEKRLGLKGKNIFLVDKRSLLKILAGYPCIKDINLEKKFPSEVRVKVEGRSAFVNIAPKKIDEHLNILSLEATPSSQTALLNWAFPSLNQGFLADNEGVIFATGSDENLPAIFWPEENLKVGQKLDGSIFSKVKKVLESYPKSKEVQLSTNILQIQMEEKVALSLQKDLDKQLASLQLILEKAKIENKPMETIDLRFDKPVVVYKSDGQR